MCALPGPGLQGVFLRVTPLGWQLLHEWRHMEVSAGVHEEGGAGALSEAGEDWGG